MHRWLLLRAVAVALLALTALAIVWEFGIEDTVLAWLAPGYPRDSIESKIEYVLLEVLFGGLAIGVAGLLLVRGLGRYRARARLQGRSAAFLQALPDLVDIADAQGRSTFLNREALRWLGLDGPPAEGSFRILDAHTPASRRHIEEVGLPAAIRDGVWSGEAEIVAGNGHTIPVSEVLVAYKNDRGEVENVATICRDITTQKEVERVKSDFVSIVSHELRTPLTSIRNSLNLVTEEMGLELPEEAAEMLRIADVNARRLVRLINDVLDLERIEYGRLDLFVQPIDAAELVPGTLVELGPVASRAGIEVVHRVEPELRLEGDRDRLAQVLINLVGNAIKFTPTGGRVEVAAARTADDGVRFSVTDSGRGIAREHVPKLFRKFQQLGETAHGIQRGTGLGLAISKSIVEQHGGTIGVESEPGRGSTFYFELPLTHPRPPLGEA